MPEIIQPHILVVDDDPQIRALLEEYLTENSLRVSAAANGKQMSAILADEAIDLVVLDLRLAGEDGMAIVRTGTSPHGQGHHTAWSMLVSEQLGIAIEDIEVIHGDTDLVPRGVGTFGSR